MRGTGATPRSGLVNVFARRIVGVEASGILVVGMGTSVNSWFVWKRRAILMSVCCCSRCQKLKNERLKGLGNRLLENRVTC